MKSKFQQISDFGQDEGVNPMDGVSNMSDAMLVLAVGIMLALVINWKIDVKDIYESQKENLNTEDLKEVEVDERRTANDVSFEDLEKNYRKTGSVYTDTRTGKTYLVVEED